jgi:hypothetical protein
LIYVNAFRRPSLMDPAQLGMVPPNVFAALSGAQFISIVFSAFCLDRRPASSSPPVLTIRCGS